MSDTAVFNNPFPEQDPRHKTWELVFQLGKEKLADVRQRAEVRNDLYDEAIKAFTGRFDAAAEAVCVAVGSYTAADTYASALKATVEEQIEEASQWCPNLINREQFLSDLRARLSQRQAYWEKQARQYARDSEMRRMRPQSEFQAQHGAAQRSSPSGEELDIASDVQNATVTEADGYLAGGMGKVRAQSSAQGAQACDKHSDVEETVVHGKKRTPSDRLTEYKVLHKLRTHDRVAEKLDLERSVYFDLKAGKRVSEETYHKAALALGCIVDDLRI